MLKRNPSALKKSMVLVTALASMSVASVITPRPVFAAPSCTDVIYLGSRGSGESYKAPQNGLGAYGSTMYATLASLSRRKNLTISYWANPYPAASTDLLKPSARVKAALRRGDDTLARAYYLQDNYRPFVASIDEGASRLSGEIRSLVSACGDKSKLVLGGYSQGAMAIHQAEHTLSHSALSHVYATLLVADGDLAPNSAATKFGTSSPRGEGIRMYLRRVSGDISNAARAANLCNRGDIVCNFDWNAVLHHTAGTQVHTSYSQAALQQLATWGASRLAAKQASPEPQPSGTPPTQPGSNRSYTVLTPTSGPAGFAVYPRLDPCPTIDGNPRLILMSEDVSSGFIYSYGPGSTTEYVSGYARSASSGQSTTRFLCAIDDGSGDLHHYPISSTYSPDLVLTTNKPGGTLTSSPDAGDGSTLTTVKRGDTITLGDSGNGCTYVPNGMVEVYVTLNTNNTSEPSIKGPVDSAGHWGPLTYTIPANSPASGVTIDMTCYAKDGVEYAGEQNYPAISYNIA